MAENTYIRWNYEKVKQFIEGVEGNGCKLSSKEYKNGETKLEIECGCGRAFKTPFNVFRHKNKRQCNDCGWSNLGSKLTKSHKTFANEVFKLVGSEYSVNTKYKNSTTKVAIKHEICGFEWDILPSSFTITGTRCPRCQLMARTKSMTKTHDMFVNEVLNLTKGDYEVLGEYKTSRIPVLMLHSKCGHEWSTSPSNFLQEKGCPECNRPNYNRDTESFMQEVENLAEGEYSVLGEYLGVYEKVSMRHEACGHTYNVRPNDFLNGGKRCPKCNLSKGERIIEDWLSLNNLINLSEYGFDDCIDKQILPFDFAIFGRNEELKFLIEYDGVQHFEPVDFAGKGEKWAMGKHLGVVKRDSIKNQYCKDNKIPLLRIPYWDFDNIEQILEEWLHNYDLLPKEQNIA